MRPSFGAHGPLPRSFLGWFGSRYGAVSILTDEKGAGLLKSGNFGVYLEEKLSGIHAD
jgi:hypothetical protein